MANVFSNLSKPASLSLPTNSGLLNNYNGAVKQPPVAKPSYSGGESLPSVNTQAYTQAQNMNTPTPLPTQTQPTQSPAPSNDGIFKSALGGSLAIGAGGGPGNPSMYQSWLARQATDKTPATQSIQSLQSLGQQPSQQVTQAQQDYNKFAQSAPYMQAAQFNPNVAADVASGRSALLGQTFGDVLQAKAKAVDNALLGQGQQITANQQAGQLGLTGQAQQIGAGTGAATLGLSQQDQQLQALNQATTGAAPRQQGYVMLDPTTGQPVGGTSGGDAAFQGGQMNTRETQGATFQGNDATLKAINGDQNNPGMIDTFNNSLAQFGLNKNDTTAFNALVNAYNGVTATQYPIIQNAFNNIVAQYAKILGSQKVNSLMTSAKGTTTNDFLKSLNDAANSVQSGLSANTAQKGSSVPSSAQTSQSADIWNF